MNNELQWTMNFNEQLKMNWPEKKSAGGFSSQWSSPPEGPHGWLRPVEHAATHTLRHQSGNNMQHDQHVDSFKQIAYTVDSQWWPQPSMIQAILIYRH